MLAVKKYPILRPLIALCMGIFYCNYHPIKISYALLFSGCCLFIAILLSTLKFKHRHRISILIGSMIFLLFFSIGILCVSQKDEKQKANWIGNIPDTTCLLMATLKSNPSFKSKSYQAIISPIIILKNAKWESVSGQLLIWIDTATFHKYAMKAGDTLLAKFTIHNMANNPKILPDIKNYYQHIQLYQQSSLNPYNIIQIHPSSKRSIGFLLEKTRTWFISILSHFIDNKEDRGLAEALLIGYKEELPKQLENAYRDAGIVHIIAISGMHLILFYAFFNTLLGVVFRKLSPKYIACIALVICWAFSFLTGAGPSVIRACVMLTFIALGPIINRSSNTINSLLASAFILLVFMPEWIWNIGFWLSYSAVLSIILWNPLLLPIVKFDNKILETIWKLICVTIAAQLFTLPILLYCFGTFPVYFLITNLLMIPLSTIILYGLLCLIIFSWVPYLNHFIGNITSKLLHIMNLFVHYVSQYPFAKITYQISFVQMFLLYAFLFISYDLIRKRIDKKQWNHSF